MGEGGMYETDMKEAMERFFSVEPFTSLRDRFNVYTVKVVSKNNYEGKDHRIDHNNDVVLEYVSKIPEVDLNNVTVNVIQGDPNFQWFIMEGTTEWLEPGIGISYQSLGGSTLIVHEAGGHGFAKLLDEDVYSCSVDNDLPDEVNDEFKKFLKERYHDRGRGLNVSATDNPTEVPWAKFLEDPRYQDEVGIYQGAWRFPYDLWRPSENSILRDYYSSWFNVPSREAIYKRVMQLSEGDDWEYDYETFVAFDQEVMKKARAKASKSTSSAADGYYKPRFVEKDSVVRESNINLPKDARLIRVEDYKGDLRNTRTIKIDGTVYVREQ